MANQKIIRVNEEIQKEVAEIIRGDSIKDARMKDIMVSVTAVDTTTDLKNAKIFISVLQDNKKDDVLDVLNGSSKFIRKELARRINLRNTPEISFKLDNSIAYGIKMAKIIHEVMDK
ncbi:30S ribosome-binding factor RbfA [Candidatus Epulonipiscium viviparus]|uniref:30S ribosome-binding factor RbfA n=1 Tax=Candidatus Epulonipiscium viviparus TaxID=420336 RepID=UPI00016C0EBD|nr:30S ribosome-binding factor RbfA [Candidatus Epulopiscium viviparus]